jgi:hypothetical protein
VGVLVVSGVLQAYCTVDLHPLWIQGVSDCKLMCKQVPRKYGFCMVNSVSSMLHEFCKLRISKVLCGAILEMLVCSTIFHYNWTRKQCEKHYGTMKKGFFHIDVVFMCLKHLGVYIHKVHGPSYYCSTGMTLSNVGYYIVGGQKQGRAHRLENGAILKHAVGVIVGNDLSTRIIDTDKTLKMPIDEYFNMDKVCAWQLHF